MDEPTQFELIPGSHRVTDRVTSRARRVPLMAWPFEILAGFLLATILLASRGSMDFWSALIIAAAVGWALLPAAVIIGRPDAWRSARAVLLGAIAWSTVGAVSRLIWSVAVISGPTSSFSAGWLSLSLIGEIFSLAAPLLILYGLSFRRRTATSWPLPVVVVAVAATGAALTYAVSNALGWYGTDQGMGMFLNDGPAMQLEFLLQTIAPWELLTVGALAWSSLSALRANEQPRRFWLALTAGSIALLALHAYNYAMSFLLQTMGPTQTAFDVANALSRAANLVNAAAIAVLLVAFTLGLPNDPLDLGEVVEETGDVTAEQGDPAAEPADLPA